VRIFSDRQHYKVGETIALDVHSRLERGRDEETKRRSREGDVPFLALITYEGEEVIGYRTLKLQTGHNRYDLPVEHAHFPNFAVGVAVMADNRFHTASREFTVERQLNIALKPDKEVYRPRDEMELDLAVTDQQGNPVAAEVGLAMVDNALLARYPDQTPNIVAFFQEGAYREAAMRTQTSCTFRYQAQTRAMVTEVLAEAERMQYELRRHAYAGLPAQSEVASSSEAVELRHANAEDVRRVLERLFEERRQGTRGPPEGSLHVAAEPVTNRIIVQGDPARMEAVRELVAQLDSMPMDSAAGRYIFGGTGGAAAGQQVRALLPPAWQAEGYARRSYGFEVAGEPTSDSLIAGTPFDRIQAGRDVQRQVDDTIARVVELVSLEPAEADRLIGDLVRGAPPRTYFPELAYWNPQITTDENGHATVRIVLPDSNTKWKLIARGVGGEHRQDAEGHRRDADATRDDRRDAGATLVGAGEAEVISKTDFFVELLTPATLIEGDKFRPAARVHCLTAHEGEVQVTLRVEGSRDRGIEGSSQGQQTRTVQVNGSGVYDVEFDEVEVADAGELVLEITAETRGEVPDAKRKLSDAIARAVPVRPWGMRIEAHAAGLARDNEFVELELPKLEGTSGEYHDLRLTVAVGSSMQRWLIEEALETGERWDVIERSYRCWQVAPPRSHADTASGLLGCLYGADYLRSQEATERRSDGATEGGAEMRLLDERAAGLIAQLLSAQNDDGGWAWTGKDKPSDPWTSAHIAWALGKARHDGQPVAAEAIGKVTAYLQKAFADALPAQTELKAVVLHGLSWVAEADYAHANRLYRNRQSLSSAALGHLALTFVRLDRKSIAAELLGVLEHRMKEVSAGPPATGARAKMVPADGSSAWMNSDLEVTALTLLAQLAVDPRAATVRPMVDYLAGAARADGWRPHKARGTVIGALATYYGGAEQQATNYTLAVSVNGRELRRVTSDDVGSVCIEIGEAELGAGKQRVDFAFAGRGEYAYAVTLSGFSREFPNSDAVRHDVLRVYGREVSPPPLEYKGRPVNPGFNVAKDYQWFRNGTGNQPVAAEIPVRVRVQRYERSNNPAGDRDYVIVQETIPAGCRLLTETLTGSFQAYDYSDNVLTLYCGSDPHLGWFNYKIVATTPGTYRIPATVVRSLYGPDVWHLNPADQVLTVLARGSKSPDEYRMTPDELYHLGRLHFDDQDYAAAGKYLRELLAGKWVLHDEPYRESVRMLLNVALVQNNAEDTVNYFEILKEKHPELLIPFEQIVQVADAYARTDQPERAYLIYRATADASFANDTAGGGVLQDEGNFLESIDFLEDLWREYPDTPQVESICYAISQTLYGKADAAGSIRPRRGGGRVTRDDVIRETIGLIERFLALYPESPIADEASYSLANAYLDLDDFQTVVRRTEQMIELFPKSKWLDRYRYIQALAFFNLADFERARELAQQVAEATYRDEQGVVRPSPNKWLALYIIGQIYHAQGKTADALDFYKKVKEHFSDAAEAISYFEQKFAELPEVTIFHPDQDGFREADEWQRHLRNEVRPEKPAHRVKPAALHEKPFVQLDYRNIKSAVLQVYRVDLMKLALVEKNLTEITAVNLAGIKPLVEKTVALGDGHDYVDKSVRIELDLPDVASEGDQLETSPTGCTGAYLVICRADELFASGLVLVTPLALEVQEDLAAQRVRVTTLDAISRSGLKNVHVKVIGTNMDRFVSGESDLRGVYVADAVSGYPTAIARDGEGHFAFYRSEGALLAMAAPVSPPPVEKPPPRGKAEYRKHLEAENRALQTIRGQELKGMFKQQQRGVQVQNAE
jgi:tetratricopeptide (TPR) repeat protein